MLGNEKISVVIALGYFDSLHIGHQKVISTAIEKARKLGVNPAVFSFDGNLRKVIGGADGKFVFTTSERKELIHALGVTEIIFAPITKTFLGKGKLYFLNYLNRIYDVKGYVSGGDYRFGKNGCGDVKYLTEYATAHGQFVITVPPVTSGDVRVSTTYIKDLLRHGEIQTANRLLDKSFFITGKVLKGRKVGRTIGFPTVNIPIPNDRAELKAGVYAGRITVDGKEYKIVLNYGNRPTFELEDKLIEGHIIDFSGDLYGKTMTVYFDEYLREIKKFDNADDLKAQLVQDVKRAKGTI